MVAVGRIADTIPMTYARSQIAPPGETMLRGRQRKTPRLSSPIGSAEALMAKAAELEQRWMQGVSGERAWMILRSQSE